MQLLVNELKGLLVQLALDLVSGVTDEEASLHINLLNLAFKDLIAGCDLTLSLGFGLSISW